jgi:YegS/Rv2252/BmrU family lipid kinase
VIDRTVESDRRSVIRIIHNPTAGVRVSLPPGRDAAETLRELLDRHGLEAEIETPPDEEAARRMVREAVDGGADVIVAAGGDGTVHLVVDSILGSDTALGILPLGRVMNVSRALGIPRDLDAAADILAVGAVRAVDIGEARAADGRTRTFLETASVGLNAAIFREVTRPDAGELRSVWRTIWTAIRYRPARMRIELDDGVVETRALMVTASIGPYVGLGMTVAPEARLDDGRFDVSVFRHFSKLELLRHLASIAFGRRAYTPHVRTYRSSRVRISSVHPLPARADMYDLGTTPVEFRTCPGALRVIAPPARPTVATSSSERSAGGRRRAASGQSVGAGSSASASGRRRL